MEIRPRFVTDSTGKRWFKPNISYIHQHMLGITSKELREIAEKGEVIKIPDDVWESVKTAEISFTEFEEGNTEGIKVQWKFETKEKV